MCRDDLTNELSVSALAFLGDSVWCLLVRRYLTLKLHSKAEKLHEQSSKMVSAAFQAKAARAVFDSLTQQERDVFIKGRNTHTAHAPRNQSKSDYHAATGLEALFGMLCSSGREERINELFGIILEKTGASGGSQ